MGQISVKLLGTPAVKRKDEPVKFPYKKTEGIFYYLCVKGQASRNELISIFWGNSDEATGRKNLRQVLYQMRKVLGDEIILTTGQSRIALNPDLPIVSDWGETGMEFLEHEEEFLSFFYIKDCAEFEEWVHQCRLEQKDRCLALIRNALQQAQASQDAKEIHRLIDCWMRWEPLEENAIREAMDIYARSGQYNLAIQMFYDYRERLQEQLDEDPGEELMEEFHKILQMKESSINEVVRSETFFYGRFDETYRINEQIHNFLKKKKNESVIIWGDMGVGKTALMEKIRSMNDNQRVISLSSQCYQSEKGFYLTAWRKLFTEVNRYVEEGRLKLSDYHKSLVEHLLSGHHSERLDMDSLFMDASYPMIENKITQLFWDMTEQYPMLIYFDDIQWMDAMSRQLLQRLMLEQGGHRLFLLATCRNQDTDEIQDILHLLRRRELIQDMGLGCFTQEETDAIVRARIPKKDICFSSEEIFYRTEGNALLLSDLLNMIRYDGWTPGAIPPQTEHLIRARLRSLSDRERQLLQVLSMYMEHAEWDELEILLHWDRLELCEELERLQHKHLVREFMADNHIAYRFHHQVYRDFVYANQSLGKRQLWHQQIAEYYESRRETSRWMELLPFLVYQYEKSGNQEKANRYRVQYYCEFFALSNENFPVLRNQIEYSHPTGAISGNEEEILTLARSILEEQEDAPNDIIATECRYLLGRAAIARGDYEEGVELIEECIEYAEAAKNNNLFLGGCRQMICYGIQADYRDVMEKYIEKGLSHLQNRKKSTDYGTFLRLKGLLYYRRDQLDEAEIILNQAIEVFRYIKNKDSQYGLSTAACHNYLGRVAWKRGDITEAENYFRQAIEIGACKYVTNGMGQFRSNLGQILYEQGRVDEAEQCLLSARECFEQNGYYWGWDRAESYLALIQWEKGDRASARRHLAQAEIMTHTIKNPDNMALVEQVRKKILGG